MTPYEFLEKVIQTAPGIIYVYDIINNKNIYSNTDAVKQIGYTDEELRALGSNLFEAIYDQDEIEQSKIRNSNILKCGDGDVLKVKFRIKTKSGEYKIYQGVETPFERDKNTNLPIKKIGTVIDITDQIRAEELKTGINDLKEQVSQLIKSKK